MVGHSSAETSTKCKQLKGAQAGVQGRKQLKRVQRETIEVARDAHMHS
jgi:hypothetical protein